MSADTNETLALVKEALGAPKDGDALRKAGITTATGLAFYDLRGPSLKTYPILTPLRNRIPRRQGRGGSAVNWKAITAINTTALPGGVSEGNRNAVMSVAEADYTRAYRGLGMENFATFEARYQGQNFEDADALASLTALQALMVIEERALLGGNTSLNLGTTPTPTLTASTTGGSIATGTVSVICVALTPDGYRYASLANGIQQQINRTNADGSTDTINGGTAIKSAAATVAVTGPNGSVSAAVTPVTGAVAYAWYAGTSGSEKIAAITTLSTVVLTALPGAGQAASSLDANDHSKDALMFDGLLTYAFTTANGGYFNALAAGTPGTGTKLTSNGGAGITEIDALFKYYWDNFKLSPDEIWCSGQEQLSITKLVVANGGAPILRIAEAAQASRPNISAGFRVSSLLNGITGQDVPLMVHPDLPAGTLLARVNALPPGAYPNAGVGPTVEVETRQEYYQIEWAPRSRKRERGVYVDEVPIVWVPFVHGVITNIAPV